MGREVERAAFRADFGFAPEDERHRFLFHVHGNAGVGSVPDAAVVAVPEPTPEGPSAGSMVAARAGVAGLGMVAPRSTVDSAPAILFEKRVARPPYRSTPSTHRPRSITVLN